MTDREATCPGSVILAMHRVALSPGMLMEVTLPRPKGRPTPGRAVAILATGVIPLHTWAKCYMVLRHDPKPGQVASLVKK